MGYIKHRLLVAQLPYEWNGRDQKLTEFTAWRDQLPEEWRHLIIGPVMSIRNGYEWVITFLPDGSKEGWDASKEGYQYAREFTEMFTGDFYQVIELTWGDDKPSVQLGLSKSDD